MFEGKIQKALVSRGGVTEWIILALAVIFFASLWLFNNSSFFQGGGFTLSGDHPPSSWETFDSKPLGISIMYPPGYAVDASYVYTELGPRRGVKGVKFTIPSAHAEGTNLASVDTGISVEVLSGNASCNGNSFVEAGLASTTLTEKGVTYSIIKTAGAGAGNFYEETVYVITGSVPCTAVRYFIHSTNIGNYEPATVRAFNKQQLLKEFDTIRRSLILDRVGAE